jgi:CubicO group peptidase (beta-lactamase class C family)
MAHSPAPTSVEERIRRIENGLLLERKPWQSSPERATLAERMAFRNVPGVSVAVIYEGRIEWARGYGVLESGKPEPVADDTLFQAGSISKALTAAAALRLVERGRLALDQDVNTFLVSWRVPVNDGWQPRLTLRHLLSHTGGTTVHGFPGYHRDSVLPSLTQVLDGKMPANTPAVFVNALPGAQYRYSGGGTSIVQQLLIDVTGKSFPDLMRELVLDPAGMEHSTFEQPLPEALWSRAATGHYWVKHNPVAGKWHVYPEMAAAGLWTTASDLARFALAIQQSATGESTGLLSAGMAAQMLTPQIENSGLGVFLSGSGETTRFGHDGEDHGFVSTVEAYTRLGLGMAIMTNVYAGERFYGELRAAIAQEYGWPDFLPEERVAAGLDSATFDDYTGEYELAPGRHWLVEREGGGLSLRVPGQDPIVLYPRSETEFFMRSVDATVSFARGENGKINGLVFRQNDRTITAMRLEI